jgi:hypothetical protein
MIDFGPFCIAHFLLAAGKMLRAKRSQFPELIGPVVVGPLPTTRDIDELITAIAQNRVAPIVLYLRDAHCSHMGKQRLVGELSKRRGRTEVSVFL